MAGIDKTLVQRRFRRSAASYRKAALVQRETAGKLLDHFHLAAGEREFDRILEIGAGDGVLTELVETRFDYRELVLLDLVPEWEPFHRERPRCRFLAGDVETVELPGPFDLILSNDRRTDRPRSPLSGSGGTGCAARQPVRTGRPP